MNSSLLLRLALLCMTLLAGARAAPPPLREQRSLNGTWEQGGAVPAYGGEAVPKKDYERRVTIPAEWQGERVRVEFQGVNHVAEVSINGRPVHRNVGGWLPFVVELAGHAKPGETFTLGVAVQGTGHPLIVDADGYKLRPIANAPIAHKTGIVDDVWLRAYGEVAVEDAFIQPSWRRKEVVVDYVLRNAADAPRSSICCAPAC
jgi:beta-galactosidase/beta-glucuronidase